MALTLRKDIYSGVIPPIDIIIPFHNNYEEVYEACKAVWYTSRNYQYRIYLVDDGSNNKFYINGFKDAPYTICVQNEKQMGFGCSLNKGYVEGNSPICVFLHADCIIGNIYLLKQLYKTLILNENIAMVSPKTNNSCGGHPLLEASSKNKVMPDEAIEDGYLPLYCVMFRRNLFNKIQGRMKEYPGRGYEDEELAHRIRYFKMKQVVCGSAWVHHTGGERSEEELNRNRELCVKDLLKLKHI